MVYNLPDESSFLITTVKGQLTHTHKSSAACFSRILIYLFFSPPRSHRWAGRRTPSDPEVAGRTDGITTTPPSAFGAEASLRPSRPASSLSSYFLLHSPQTKGQKKRRRSWRDGKQRDCVYSHVNVRIWHGCVHCFILKTLLTEGSQWKEETLARFGFRGKIMVYVFWFFFLCGFFLSIFFFYYDMVSMGEAPGEGR